VCTFHKGLTLGDISRRQIMRCLTRIARGFGEVFGLVNLARLLCHSFTVSPSSASRRIVQTGDRIASSPAGVSLIAIWCPSPRLSIQP